MSKAPKAQGWLQLLGQQIGERIEQELLKFKHNLAEMGREDLTEAQLTQTQRLMKNAHSIAKPYLKILKKPYLKVQQTVQKGRAKIRNHTSQ